jgi:nucleotide-binding universal stress UspA family protein
MADPIDLPAASGGPVVVGYADRPEGHDALALGAGLAVALGAPLLVASIHPGESPFSPVTADELRAEADRMARGGLERLPEDLAVDADAAVFAGDSPARGLHELAENEDASAIVVGSSHRGALGRVLAGTGATQLLSGSPCPVAVAPRGLAAAGPVVLRRIGVGFDDSRESWDALRQAAALAVATEGSVRVVHALAPLTAPATVPLSPAEADLERRRAGELATARAVSGLPARVSPESRLITGAPVEVLEAEGRGDIDLLVLGSRAFGPLRRVLLGSVSAELMRQAPCPVMVVPRPAAEAQHR